MQDCTTLLVELLHSHPAASGVPTRKIVEKVEIKQAEQAGDRDAGELEEAPEAMDAEEGVPPGAYFVAIECKPRQRKVAANKAHFRRVRRWPEESAGRPHAAVEQRALSY